MATPIKLLRDVDIATDSQFDSGAANKIATCKQIQDFHLKNYLTSLNPEGLGGSSFESYLLRGGGVFTNNKWYSKALRRPDRGNSLVEGSNDEGIDGKCTFIMPNTKHTLDGAIDLNDKSFIFSWWWKGDTNSGGNDNAYMLGNTVTGTAHKTLHIGYRDNDTFTIAFYADDVNINLGNGFKHSDIKNKWTHFLIHHNKSNKKSGLYINGTPLGAGTHSQNYQAGFNLMGGYGNTSRMQGKFSQTRLYIAYGAFSGFDTGLANRMRLAEMKYLEKIH